MSQRPTPGQRKGGEMSFYNMLFGVNSATVLLAALGMTADDVPRFRNCYIDGEQIVIHTRTGGGNRSYFDNDSLAAHACYLYDEDDDFDSTYANFHFKFPEEYADDLKALAERSETYKPSEKWQALLKALAPGTEAGL